MSLSVKTFNYNLKRDSFEDRVCDDLCEALLQFLPIEDKFKFECVSKQFQRNVFQRHEELCLTRRLMNRNTSIMTREEESN